MKYIIFLVFLLEITNIPYTCAIVQIYQKNMKDKDLKNFQKYLYPSKDLQPLESQMNELDSQKLVQCKICEKMFELDFNYDKLLHNNNFISDIRKYFKKVIPEEKIESIFKNENLEFLMKEVSMQYFFKGGDTQFSLINKSKTKMSICEEILGYDRICTNLDKEDKENKPVEMVHEMENKQINTAQKDNSVNAHETSNVDNKAIKNESELHESKKEINAKLIKELLNSDDNTLELLLNKLKSSKKENQPKQRKLQRKSTQSLVPENIPLENHTNSRVYESTSDNEIKNLIKKSTTNPSSLQKKRKSKNDSSHDISLLEITPEYIQKNFDSVPKTHWSPPQPVLLNNFQNSIGIQLGEITRLTTEISNLEKTLLHKKQELANKLEIAKTSYNVVQRTLTQISKIVNQNGGLPLAEKTENCNDDDWEESEKKPNKFLTTSG